MLKVSQIEVVLTKVTFFQVKLNTHLDTDSRRNLLRDPVAADNDFIKL